MNLSQHPLYNKSSTCQLLEWDRYREGHEVLWTSNWRKPRSRKPATEDTSIVYVCIFYLFHLFLILTSWGWRAGLGHLLCMFTWVLFVLMRDRHRSSSGWICVAGCEYSVCVCVCVCVCECMCASVCVSVRVWRVASQHCYWVDLGTQNWSSFSSMGLRRHHWS